MVNVVDFFDPSNKEHIAAFDRARNSGGLWPIMWHNHHRNLNYPSTHQIQILIKIADHYISSMLHLDSDTDDCDDWVPSEYNHPHTVQDNGE
jgi:hypothetical protein